MATAIPGETILVGSEAEAVDALQSALLKRFEGADVRMDFKDWPTLKLVYTGEKFHGTITPDIAQAIVDLQETLNRSYALAINQTSNLRSLSDEDRRLLQVVASVDEGSSLVEVNLGAWAEKLSTELVGKMTGTEIVVVVLGSALVITAGFLVKLHVKVRSEEKKLSLENDQRLALSQEETRRLQVVTDAMRSNSVVRETNERAEIVRDALLKSAFDAESFSVQDSVTLSGEEARKTYRARRREPLAVQLNGNYSVKSFAWEDDGQSARVKVRREDDGIEYVAEIALSAMRKDQQGRFKDATFEQARVFLTVNATMLDDQITTARIASVDEQPPKEPGLQLAEVPPRANR